MVRANTRRMVDAFRLSGLTSVDLMGSTGYGYDDRGRSRLDEIVASVFGTESAMMRSQWASGTHALTTALKAVTVQSGRLVIVSGTPYDTILPTLSQLEKRGVKVEIGYLSVQSDRRVFPADLAPRDVVYIQRSRGYASRPSWGKSEIAPIVEWARQAHAIVMVDNCYGEFTQPEEPGHWGADLVVGSLMKNPGGTIAPTGAYVAGRRDLVQQVAEELYSPGIGGEVGATAPYLRLMAQGFFLAPQLVGESLMGGLYLSHAAFQRGIAAWPAYDDANRNDIVVALDLERADRVVAFCRAIQAWSPVDATASPEPWQMPGYDHPVVMAAGGFVSGGSLELSADAPMRPPYTVYVQAGTNRWHTELAVDAALNSFID